ncbi:MAG: hypothetical protein V1487_00280 [bacterium]
MKKLTYLAFLFSVFFLLVPPTRAQTTQAADLRCDVSMYKVYRNSSLPYSYNGTLVPSGTRTNFDSYYVYSLNLKNLLAVPTPTTISRVYTTNISGGQEPLSILDYKMYPPGSICIENLTDKTISCNSNHQFLNSTNGFTQILVKVNQFQSDKYNTSTLFTIETDKGKVECANMLMLDQSLPINTDAPVNWKTKFASFSADHFMLMIGNNQFFLGKEPVAIHSDGYDDGSDNTYTTLESTWYEDPYGYDAKMNASPVEMRLYLYFRRTGSTWELTELRTYGVDANQSWLYYDVKGGGTITSTVGTPFKQNVVFTDKSGANNQIICNGCSINAFMDLASSVDMGYAINSSADSPITITNEPGTWFTIKVGLESKNTLSSNYQKFSWDYSPNGSLNLENLNSDGSLIRINGSEVGTAKLSVKAYDTSNSDSRLLATKHYVVKILDGKATESPQCTFINQPIFKSKQANCCDGLSLIPANDEQVSIVGYCVDKNSPDTQYDKLQAELDSMRARLEKTEVKQTAMQRILADVQTMVTKILKLLRLK